MSADVLDWRELAPMQSTHYCDCDYCDQEGELEPIQWPTLVPVEIGGVDYVTDRRIMIRADFAPIPEGYEGPVLARTTLPASGFIAASLSSKSAAGKRFRSDVIKAVQVTGWKLRDLVDNDACAVVTPGGEHIGWAMPAKSANDGREYQEQP